MRAKRINSRGMVREKWMLMGSGDKFLPIDFMRRLHINETRFRGLLERLRMLGLDL